MYGLDRQDPRLTFCQIGSFTLHSTYRIECYRVSSIHTSVHSNVRPALSYFQRTILEPLSLPLPRPHLQVTVLLSCRALFVCRDLVVFRGLLFLPPPDALAGRFSQSQTLTHGNEGMEPSYYLISRDSCAKPRSQGNF